MKFFKENYFLLLILIFAAIILSINLNKPFIGHHDWNSVWYSNIARNFTRYGFIQTKFGQVTNNDFVSAPYFSYFTHYPPLLPILISISFRVFGIHEWSARLVPLLFSLGTIAAVYFLTLKFFDKKTAILASAISTVLPIMIYFGKMPVQEVLTIAPVLFAIYLYFNFVEKPNRTNFIKLVTGLILSHLINWPGYYVTPLFFVHYLIFGKAGNKLKIAASFPAFSVFMFLLHCLHLILLTGKPLGGGMLQVFIYRLNLADKPIGYSTINFLKLQAKLIEIYFTIPVLMLSAVALFWILGQIKNRKLSRPAQLLLMLAAFGVTHNTIFRNMAYIHDYMIIYLLPFFSVAASVGAFYLLKRFKLRSYQTSILCILLIFAMLFEQHKFVSALLSSNGFKEGVELGKSINSQTASGDKVLILSPDFNKYFDVFVTYYADRELHFDPRLPVDLASPIKYKLIVAMPKRDTIPADVDFLVNHYNPAKTDDFIVFNTEKPI